MRFVVLINMFMSLWWTVFSQEAVPATIETYTFQNFPKEKVAVHFSCAESNMFATNCACHLRCTDSQCDNAKNVCLKYASKGCKYMLLRGGKHNRIATLKRVPSVDEYEKYDVSKYPKSFEEMEKSKWATMLQQVQRNSSNINKNALFKNMLPHLKEQGERLLRNVFELGANSSAPYCGKRFLPEGIPSADNTVALTSRQRASAQNAFLSRGIALVAVSYHTPRTLLNTMRSWQSSGLLDMVTEKIVILNDPIPQEVAIALEHGFRIVQPKDITDSKMSKPNVWTIGAAFYYALNQIKSEYLLFLENDFKMDVQLSPQATMLELMGGAALLDSGIEIIRLNSRKYQGCNTFKSCDHHGINLQSPHPGDRLRNWFAFYCRNRKVRDTASSVSDCLSEPDYRCFTSWDTNWTLNAVLVKKETMLNKKYPMKDISVHKSIAAIGLEQFHKQDGFESVMISTVPWQKWRVPICIAYQGLFIHDEIETSA